MTVFRGCIDIHSGKVKQIVGGKLVKDDTESDEVETNFVSEQPSSYYAQLYKQNQIYGTHVIKLGSLKANDDAAREALGAWRGLANWRWNNRFQRSRMDRSRCISCHSHIVVIP